MAEVTGWKYPGTAASVTPGDVAWSNPNNIKAEADAAEAALFSTNVSEWLKATNFGFDTNDVPSGASIVGIEFAIETAGDGGSSDSVRLLDGDGNLDGDDKKADLEFDTLVEYTLGGASDDWNWAGDDSDVRSSSFGIQFKALNDTAKNWIASCWYVQCRIHYQGPDALNANDLTSTAPVLGEPTLAQIHALTADDLDGAAPVLEEPTLNALWADDLDSAAPVLGEPAIGQEHALTADNLDSAAPVLAEPTIGQHHELTADGLDSAAPALGEPTVAEIHNLMADDLDSAAPVLGSPSLIITVPHVQVLVYQNNVNVARLRHWEKLYYTQVDSGVGFFELVVPNNTAAEYLVSGNEILVLRNTDKVFTGKLLWGIHEWKETGEQSETVTVRGASAEKLPRRRIVRPAGDNEESHTAPVDDAMKAFVRSAYVSGTASASRAITGFSVEADASQHPDTKTLTGEYKDDLIEKLNQWHDAYDVDWWVDRDIEANTWEFKTGYPQRGTDRSATVVFSLNRRNVRSLTYTKDDADLENLIYVGGPGEGAEQHIETVYDGAEPTGADRHESFVAAPDARFTDDLEMVGEARLAVFGESVENVTFQYQSTYGTYWLRDFEVGDVVSIYDPIYDVTLAAKIEWIGVTVLQVEPELVEDIEIRIGPTQADQWKRYENRLGAFAKLDVLSDPSAPLNPDYTL